MAKIINFVQDVDYYLDGGIELLEDGRYLDGIDMLNNGLKYYPYSCDLYIELADAYFEIGELNEAIALYIKVIAEFPDYQDAYYGLIQCYMKQDMYQEALYYIRMGTQYGILEPDDTLGEIFEDEIDTRPRLRVLEKDESDKLIVFARKLINGGELEFAEQMLKGVKPESSYYLDARNLLSFVSLAKTDADSAILYAEEVLSKKPEDITALSAAIIGTNIHEEKDGETMRQKRADYKDRLLALKVTELGDLTRIATTFQQLEDSETALKYYEKIEEMLPYNKEVLLILALIYHNLGDEAKSKNYFLTVQRLYPSDFRLKHFAKVTIVDKKGAPVSLCTVFPKEEADLRVKELETWLMDKKSVAKTVRELKKDRDMHDNVLWLFQTDNISMQCSVGRFLAQSREWEDFIRELLVNPDIAGRVKKECLVSMLKFTEDKRFALLTGDYLTHFTPKLPKSAGSPLEQEIYWNMYATLAFTERSFDRKLNLNYNKFIKLIKEKFEITDDMVGVLSAVFAARSKIAMIFKSAEDCCEVFGINPEDFYEMYEKLYGTEETEKLSESVN